MRVGASIIIVTVVEKEKKKVPVLKFLNRLKIEICCGHTYIITGTQIS